MSLLYRLKTKTGLCNPHATNMQIPLCSVLKEFINFWKTLYECCAMGGQPDMSQFIHSTGICIYIFVVLQPTTGLWHLF